jgi:hypothetical protein
MGQRRAESLESNQTPPFFGMYDMPPASAVCAAGNRPYRRHFP